jgi:hypothetical protein
MSAEEIKETTKKPAAKKDDKEYTWPGLVFKEYLAGIFVMAVLMIWSLTIMAPLGELANPGITENPAKAPWYFLGLQELLVYFDPWIAGVMLPNFIVTGLIAIPYLDTNPRGSGGYALNLRKFANYNYMFGFVMWWALILVGTFLRGPNWNFYWPWESWAIHKEVEEALIYQPGWGPAFLALYFIVGMVLPWILSKNFMRKLGVVRYTVLMSHLLIMYFVIVKIVLRLVFNVRYVWATPWFNI